MLVHLIVYYVTEQFQNTEIISYKTSLFPVKEQFHSPENHPQAPQKNSHLLLMSNTPLQHEP